MSANSAGQATALTILTPIHPDQHDALATMLTGFSKSRPLAALPRTHFARWVIIDALFQVTGQPLKDTVDCPYLLFTSNLDGNVDTYLDELAAAPEVAAVWTSCIGCPTPASGAPLAAYLRHNMIDNGFFYSAYPHVSVDQVRRALALSRRVKAFALAAQQLHGTELRDTFLRELA